MEINYCVRPTRRDSSTVREAERSGSNIGSTLSSTSRKSRSWNDKGEVEGVNQSDNDRVL